MINSFINYSEVLSYLRFKGHTPPEDIEELIRKNIAECEAISERLETYGEFPIRFAEGAVILEGADVVLKSESLKKRLTGCDRVVVFAVTIGRAFERELKKKMLIAPHEGLVFDACGSAAAEALAEGFQNKMKEKYGNIKERFSPGYGDLDISVQPQLLGAVNAQKRIGLSCLESYLLTPAKSVTAIIGIEKKQ